MLRAFGEQPKKSHTEKVNTYFMELQMEVSNKDEAKLTEKLTTCYNTQCEAKITMTLATIQAEVKKFWQTVRETRELT